MGLDLQHHHRQSIRLRGYDYTQNGAYFVTICTVNRECLFGEITNAQMQLNAVGQIVQECWLWLGQQYPYVGLDSYVIMPNHLHGILVIQDCRGGSRTAPTRKPLGRLIGAFKTVSTPRINTLRATPGLLVWQRNYYEHIIRNEHELEHIRQYIVNNPAKWEMDVENPAVMQKDVTQKSDFSHHKTR